MQTCLLLFLVLGLGTAVCDPLPLEYSLQQYVQHPAVIKFREYLRIDTSQEHNLNRAVEFWRREASELGLPFAVYHPATAGRPVCVLTWEGRQPALPSLMLNSHMDVVGVEPEDWTYPPFAAHIDESGDIYARGAQDDKDVSIQYIEAIGRLMRDNVTLQRTVHVTLMPDEETGGFDGMLPFLDTAEFEALNVGFALDEGITSKDDTLYVMYMDKRPWEMKFTVHGPSGHGSTMEQNTAMEKLHKLINALSEYRDLQQTIEKSGGPFNSVNINVVNGGYAQNVVPGKMSLIVDIRLSPSTNVSEINDLVNSWAALAGNDTEVEFIRRLEESTATAVDDSNPYWETFRDAATDMGITVEPVTASGTSDMVYVRERGVPALGFAPKSRTADRLHGANEYLNVATFLNGIDVYVGLLKRLGQAEPQ